jgi:hypothetical protein
MSVEDRKKLACLRKQAYELNKGLENDPDNDKHYAVVNEHLVVFEAASRSGEGRLVGGVMKRLAYTFSADGQGFKVTLN